MDQWEIGNQRCHHFSLRSKKFFHILHKPLIFCLWHFGILNKILQKTIFWIKPLSEKIRSQTPNIFQFYGVCFLHFFHKTVSCKCFESQFFQVIFSLFCGFRGKQFEPIIFNVGCLLANSCHCLNMDSSIFHRVSHGHTKWSLSCWRPFSKDGVFANFHK